MRVAGALCEVHTRTNTALRTCTELLLRKDGASGGFRGLMIAKGYFAVTYVPLVLLVLVASDIHASTVEAVDADQVRNFSSECRVAHLLPLLRHHSQKHLISRVVEALFGGSTSDGKTERIESGEERIAAAPSHRDEDEVRSKL